MAWFGDDLESERHPLFTINSSMQEFHFFTLKPYESVVRVIRRHPMAVSPHPILYVLLLILPILFFNPLQLVLFPALLLINPFIITFGLSFYYLFVITIGYSFYVRYHLDVLILTNDRLIKLEQKNIFSQTIAEVDLYQLLDATSEIKGFFSTLFGFGDIEIETAGPQFKFIAKSVSDPHHLRRLILDLAAKDKHFHTKSSGALTEPTPRQNLKG